MEILKTENLTKIYGKTKETQVYALDNVNLTIEEGKFTAVTGRSGSGKSTLLHMLGGVDSPTKGKVFFGGKSLHDLRDKERTILRRRRIGFIFQSYNLVPELTVYENMLLPLKMDHRREDTAYTEELMDKLGLGERKKFYPHQLSGGQQQRVAIGRALITKPAVILADEPTGNLDAGTGDEVLALLKKLAREYHQTLVVVTHDAHVAQMADRIVRIGNGKLLNNSGMESS